MQNHNHRDFILEHTVHHGIGYWRTKKVYQYSAIALGSVIGLDTPLRFIASIRNAELNLVAIDTAPLVNQGDVIPLTLAVPATHKGINGCEVLSSCEFNRLFVLSHHSGSTK